MENKENKHEVLSRRQVLKASAAAVGAAALAPLATVSAASEPTVTPHNLKLTMCAYSMRDALTSGKMDMFGFIDYCAKMDIPGADLTQYYFKKDFDKSYLLDLKRHAHKSGITISGTAVGNDFCQPPGPERDKQVEMVKQWIDYAAEMFSPHLRIFGGRVKEGQDKNVVLGWCADAIKTCLEYADKRGVFLGLENHGGITERVEDILTICKMVGDNHWFGLNLDTGNFHQDVWESMAKAAPLAVNVHIKADMYNNDGSRFDADLSRVRQVLIDGGYKGWLALEYESDVPADTGVPLWLGKMKKTFECAC